MENTETGIVIGKVKEKFPELVLGVHSDFGDDTIIVKKEGIIEVCRFLKDEPELSFDMLMDLTAVDYLGKGKEERFEMVYHFYSLKHNHRVRIKTPVSEKDCNIDSIENMWIAANWAEREVWDLYGIKFNGHPDLRRILLYEPFDGHPLRKDYPIQKRQPLIGPLN